MDALSPTKHLQLGHESNDRARQNAPGCLYPIRSLKPSLVQATGRKSRSQLDHA